MTLCGVPHPDHPEVRCEAPEGRHTEHYARPEWLWPNPEVQAQQARIAPMSPTDRQRQMTAMAQAIRAGRRELRDDPTVLAGALQREPRDTSRAALYATMPRTGTQRWEALLYIRDQGERGATHEEIRLRFDWSYSASTTRPQELEMGEWIEDSGRRRRTTRGQDAIVWVLSAEGRRKLTALGH
jgi:hypothetical protein